MPDIFDTIQSDLKGGDIFDQVEIPESFGKSAFRTAVQAPLGYLKKSPISYIPDIFKALVDTESQEVLRQLSENDPDLVMSIAEEARKKSIGKLPTQDLLEEIIEEKTGIPLRAKTDVQKSLRLGGTAAGFSPGTALQKTTSGIIAPAASEGLKKVGTPEPVAEALGLLVSGPAGQSIPSKLESVTKPSGLPLRRFEKVTQPTEVSTGKLEKISEKLESDFKKISDEIIETSSIGKTRETLKENPSFKAETAQQFKEVEKLAESLHQRFNTDLIKNKLDKIQKKETGFTPSDYDKDYRKFVNGFIDDTTSQEIGVVDAVRQYRKNNKSLAEAFDPSSSKAFNRAKKDALLDYNRAISEVFDDLLPNSEFTNLFKLKNKQWSQIADAENIDKFIDAFFGEKINFSKGKRFFENDKISGQFKRALGEENFSRFEQLMKDMLKSEVPFKMLKQAKQRGWDDLFKTGISYLLHPTLGKTAATFNLVKNSYRSLMNSLLDKPQLTVKWDNAFRNLSKGNFAEAEKQFKELDSEVRKSDESKLIKEVERKKSIKKFNEKLIKKS